MLLPWQRNHLHSMSNPLTLPHIQSFNTNMTLISCSPCDSDVTHTCRDYDDTSVSSITIIRILTIVVAILTNSKTKAISDDEDMKIPNTITILAALYLKIPMSASHHVKQCPAQNPNSPWVAFSIGLCRKPPLMPSCLPPCLKISTLHNCRASRPLADS